MSKQVFREAKIVVGGHDISHWVTRWAIDAKIGELYDIELDVITDPRKGGDCPLEIEARGQYDATVKVNGTDISSHVFGWCNRARFTRLFLHADKNVITINGTAPWEVPA